MERKSHSSVPMAREMASGCAIGKRAWRTMEETFLKKDLLSTTRQIRRALPYVKRLARVL